MPGVTTGILCNALPLSAEHVKSVEKEVLEKQETFAYIDENSELCFSLPSNPDVIKDLAWNNAYELCNVEGTLTKNAYRRTGLETFILDKTFIKQGVEDSWSDSTIPTERLEGDGQEFYTTAPSTLSFRSTAPLEEFQDVQINGQTVDPSNYTLEEGSTIVKLSHEYLKTLDVGNHEITVVSNSQAAKGNFTVTAPELNEHNFYYNQPYYLTKEIQAEEAVRLILVFLSAETLSAFNTETGDYRILPYTYNDSKLTFSYKLFMEELLFSLDHDSAANAFVGSVSSSMVQNTQEVIFEKSAKIVGDTYYLYVKADESEEWQCFWNRKAADQYPPMKDNICGEPVTNISVGGFEACESLTQVILPDTIHTLWERSFSNCSHLESVVLPAGLTNILDCAFIDCESLNTIVFKGTIEQWNAIQKFNSWNLGIPAAYVQCSDGQVAL